MAVIHFGADIRPLFRQGDISCMRRHAVMLIDTSWMTAPSGGQGYPDHANARLVFDQLDTDSMPPDQPWPADRKALYKSWMEGGFLP